MATDNFARLQTEMGCLCRCSSGSRQTSNQQATKTPNEKTSELITRRGSAGRHSRSHPSERTTGALSDASPACIKSGRSFPCSCCLPRYLYRLGEAQESFALIRKYTSERVAAPPLCLVFYFLVLGQ